MRMMRVAFLGVFLLVGCGGKSTDERLTQLRDKDSAQRLHAIKELREKKSEAGAVVPALAQALGDEDAFVRRDAARALGGFGANASSALPALRVAAKDRNTHVRQAATEAIHQITPAPPEGGKR
jgi:HEAT repeat protein